MPVTRLVLAPGGREDEIAAAAEPRGVRVERGPRPVLDQLARTPHHQGVVAFTRSVGAVPLEALLDASRGALLVLDGVQDPRNLGAILRSARAAGVGGVVLPRDRSAGVTPVVVAASAGLIFGLDIARVGNLVRAMEVLKDAGWWLVGLAPRAGRPLPGVELPGRLTLVAGGEGGGLRPLVARHCDLLVSIPMAPGVESLNVSVAVAVALYELVTRRSSVT
jgi:23S rRNA (guanosine2251-2'-O)-methyltransferase